MIYEATSFECSRIAQDLQIRKLQVEAVVQLFNEGNTVPFITRYRKERTGGLDEDAIRQILARLNFLKTSNERKQTILRSIENQGRLTNELRREILHAPTVRRLEDLYLPFKPKKKGLALAAREKGLEPLALAIWHSDPAIANLDELLPALVDPAKQLNTVEDVKTGVQHILAEMITETAEVRAPVRRLLWKASVLTATKHERVPEGQGNEYKPYFQFKESTQDIRPHRILALNRGEKDGALKIRLEWPMDVVTKEALSALAEHLLKVAGQPPQPTAPPQPSPPPSPEPAPPVPQEPPQPETIPPAVPVPGEPPAPDAPAPPTPPESPQEMPPSAPQFDLPDGTPVEITPAVPPMESPAHETPSIPSTPMELPSASPPFGMPPPPHASPLVDSLAAGLRPELTGECLVEGHEFRSPHVAFLKVCLDDALNRLMLPSLEREIRGELTDEAELHAVKVLAHNIRSLLMQPPLIGKRVLAINPGFRTGCKLAALNEQGNLLDHLSIYPFGGAPGEKKPRRERKKPDKAAPAPAPAPVEGAATDAAATPPVPSADAPGPESPAPTSEVPAPAPNVDVSSDVLPPAPAVDVPAAEAPPAPVADAPPTPEPVPVVDKVAEAKAQIIEFVKKHNLQVAAIGNGAACREIEVMLAEAIASDLADLSFVVISEAGASAYAVSPIAKEEFPNLEAGVRVAVTIGRRLQDPLGELVKIEPPSLGVGLYQHDMGRKELKEALEGVVESCVNQVGVDVNTAGVPLLRCVAGLNPMAAREIVEHRQSQGPFTSREQLLSLPTVGPLRHAQAVGFIKVPGAPNPLDRTWIHPESYPLAERVLTELGYTPSVLDDKAAHAEFRNKLNEIHLEEFAKHLDVSVPTLDDLFFALARPGRDPRDEMPAPIFKKGILKLEEMQPGMELKGTVLNVVDFGAFVDVGLKDSGLVHISQMANKYIKSPYDVVAVNDIVTVWVLKVDQAANHVSLTMIKPGSDRQPAERGQRPPRREVERQPPDRDQRPAPRGRGGPSRDASGPQRQGGPPQRGRRGPPRQGQGAASREPREVIPPPPPEPRKPKRDVPKPKLTQEAMAGKAPLRTLGELAAFFAAKEEKENAPAPVETKEANLVEPTPLEPQNPPGESPAS